jgi:hypothetical protein
MVLSRVSSTLVKPCPTASKYTATKMTKWEDGGIVVGLHDDDGMVLVLL